MMMPLINLRRSWQDSDIAPEGYFAVYVGPGRTRFVIKTESVNHPLFCMLLEEDENEYDLDFVGPLTLHTKVLIFSFAWKCTRAALFDQDGVSIF